MLEPLEIKGNWWLPDDRDKKLSGVLTYSQETGSILELDGVYSIKQTKRFQQPKIILGITHKGEHVTLHHCQYIAVTYPILGVGFSNAKYRARFTFVGVHFEKEADILFNQIFGNYTDLDAWVNIFGFTIERYTEKDHYKTIVKYKKPEAQFIQISDEYEIGIGFSSHGPNWAAIQTKVKITQRAYLIAKSKKGDVPLEELFNLLNQYTYLHQIGVQRINYPVDVFGFTGANAENIEGGKNHYPEVKIYFSPIEAYIERRAMLPPEMLFTYKDLDNTHIENWFNLFDKYAIAIHLYRSLFYSNRLFIETRFLNMAQALESLHSILFENHYLSKEEFEEKRQRVLNAVPEDLKEWVKTALKSANYKRFRLKIFELLENKSHLFSKCIADNDEFAKRVIDTRNEFVHHNERKHSFRGGEELVSAIYLMRYLFEAYILEIIGFSDDSVKKIFKARIGKYLTRWKKL